jgi:hypothetical protein
LDAVGRNRLKRTRNISINETVIGQPVCNLGHPRGFRKCRIGRIYPGVSGHARSWA